MMRAVRRTVMTGIRAAWVVSWTRQPKVRASGHWRFSLALRSLIIATMTLLVLAASALAASRPAVVTGAASAITQVSATLHATVNPEGATVTECKLEYGTLLSYGQTAPCVPSPGSGATAVKVSAEASSLSASTEYHYRIVAENAGGASYGKDKTFKTPSATLSPTVTKLTPTTGPTTGGTKVTITGANFLGETHVTFGSVDASTVTVNSPLSITAYSPKEAAGKMPVTVTTPTGTSSVSTNDYFTFARLNRLRSKSPPKRCLKARNPFPTLRP